MSDQDDKLETAHLERVNEQLKRSLKLCHSMLDDYRTKLADNQDEPRADNDEEDADRREA